MTNSNSTFIVTIAGVTISAIVLSMFLTVYYERNEISRATSERIETLDIRNRDNDFLQYSGSILDGTKVRSLIKSSYAKDIVIDVYTINASGNLVTMSFDYRRNKFTSSTGGTKTDFYEKNSSGKTLPDLLLETSSGWYIDPMDTFRCEIEMSSGIIDKLVLRRN